MTHARDLGLPEQTTHKFHSYVATINVCGAKKPEYLPVCKIGEHGQIYREYRPNEHLRANDQNETHAPLQ